MIPIKSNLNKETCSPTSSNCVIWQGEDISCINLCNGDTISDVVYKLAVELCDLKAQLNLTDLDLKCLVAACITCPQPVKTLEIVLQLLIDKVCDLQDLIDSTNTAQVEPTIRIASCFFPDFTDSNGDVTNPVPISTYVQKIAQKLCTAIQDIEGIKLDIDSINNTLVDYDERLDILEQAGEVQVIPICSSSPTLKDIDVAFNGLEASFCQLRGATGLPGDLLDVIDAECQPIPPANTIASLLDPTVVLWTAGSSVTIADTLTKMWLAICDLRGAVSLIQDTCCQVNCDDLIVDFDVILDYNKQADEYSLLFFFGQKTELPLAFGDCNVLGTKFNITDDQGHSNFFYIKIREDVLNDPDALTNGYSVPLPGNILPTSTISLSSNVCITNGELNCVKCLNKEILYVPPVCDYCLITATGEVTITYEICPTTTTTTIPFLP
jgi:hypothetical protein